MNVEGGGVKTSSLCVLLVFYRALGMNCSAIAGVANPCIGRVVFYPGSRSVQEM
jgi:hypothetical protein